MGKSELGKKMNRKYFTYPNILVHTVVALLLWGSVHSIPSSMGCGSSAANSRHDNCSMGVRIWEEELFVEDDAFSGCCCSIIYCFRQFVYC